MTLRKCLGNRPNHFRQDFKLRNSSCWTVQQSLSHIITPFYVLQCLIKVDINLWPCWSQVLYRHWLRLGSYTTYWSKWYGPTDAMAITVQRDACPTPCCKLKNMKSVSNRASSRAGVTGLFVNMNNVSKSNSKDDIYYRYRMQRELLELKLQHAVWLVLVA